MNSISIDLIRMDGGTQPRASINFDVVEAYLEAMEAGAKFPAVDVFFDGSVYWLADGFHRVKAAYGAGLNEIACRIHQGTLEDAQWFSIAANQTNGLYRSNADKQRAIEAALRHPKSQGLSDSAIAKHVGVDQKTVSTWRGKLAATQEIPKSEIRTGRDGRTINTENIGKRKTDASAKPALQPEPQRKDDSEALVDGGLQYRARDVEEPEPHNQFDPAPLIWACDAIIGIIQEHGPDIGSGLTREQMLSVEKSCELLKTITACAAA